MNCKYYYSEEVQSILHEFCANMDMKKINHVQANEKLVCMGERCNKSVPKIETFEKKNAT
jgi:hypothetical protein